jgi:hypothetical protein
MAGYVLYLLDSSGRFRPTRIRAKDLAEAKRDADWAASTYCTTSRVVDRAGRVVYQACGGDRGRGR